jgi:integrase
VTIQDFFAAIWEMLKEALDARISAARSGEPMPDWTTHDLRRSMATGMADLGIAPHIIEQILNHVSGHKGGVAGIYNRSTYEAEVAKAMALWADHVRSITEGTERKIIPLQRPA